MSTLIIVPILSGIAARTPRPVRRDGRRTPRPLPVRARAESPEVKARVDASTAEFHAHQITQRPAFVLTDTIGDKAVFSGLVRAEPVASAIEAMLADTAAYAAHAAHFGTPPPQ